MVASTRPRCGERRLNDGRGDADTPDLVLRIMNGDRLRQHDDDAPLGNGVGVHGEAGDHLQPQHRGDVHDGTPSLLDHGRNDGTGEPEHPAEERIHGLVPCLVGHFVSRTGVRAAPGVIDQDVHAPASLQGRVDGALNVGFLSHAAGRCERVISRL